MRLLKALFIAAAGTLLLSGCTPVQSVYARTVGDGVQVRSCVETPIERIEIQIAEGGSVDWTTVWDVAGDPVAGFGYEFHAGRVPNGWNESVSLEDPDVLVAKSIMVNLWYSEQGAYSEVFEGTELRSMWQAADGWYGDPECSEP